TAVAVALRIANDAYVGAKLEAAQHELGPFAHGRLHVRNICLQPIERCADQYASCTGAQTSIPRSVAKQQAIRSISAPFACIKKFRRDLMFGSGAPRTRQPNAV